MDEQGGGTSTQLSFKIIGHLSKVLARNQAATKSEMKELDKDLALLGQADADALVEAGTLELLLRYLAVDQHFDVIARCLMALSAYDTARTGLYDMHQSGVAHLAKSMFNHSRGAKGEKQIERATALGKILVLYSIDAPDAQMGWLVTLCDLLTESLEKATTKAGQQEAYVYLSVVLPSMWVSMGSSLAPTIASHIIEAGGMPLLLRVAKEVQRNDIKGLPKIIAEKALNLLCACNAEQPEMSLEHVDVRELANFCVETTTKSDWVQSQELSLVLLGRLVFLQHALPEEYLDTEPVIKMIQHALETKSPALRMTALCLSFICSEALFELVCVEANKVIVELGQGTFQSVKRLSGTTSGGMTVLRWGQAINKFAQDLLRGSTLLARMAESVPVHLPSQLVELLTPDLKTYVTGIKAAHGVRDSPAPKATMRTAQHLQPMEPLGEEYPEDEAAPVQAMPERKPLAAANSGAAANGLAAPRVAANGQAGAGSVRVASNVMQVIKAAPPRPAGQVARPAGAMAPGLIPKVEQGGNLSQKRPRQPNQAQTDSEDYDAMEEPVKRSKVGGAPGPKADGGAPPNAMVHHHMASMMAAARTPTPTTQAPGQPRPFPNQQQHPLNGQHSRAAQEAMLAAQQAVAVAQATMAKVAQHTGHDPQALMHAQGILAAANPALKAQLGQQARAPLVKGQHPLQPPVHASQQGGGMSSVPPHQAVRAGGMSNGTTGTSGEGARTFTTGDLSQLNTFLYEMMIQGEHLGDKAKQVLDQLFKAMEKVGKLLPLKHRLPHNSMLDVEISLRQWAARVRQIGNGLGNAKGPALDMLVSFSNMMVEEITAYLDDAERQAQHA